MIHPNRLLVVLLLAIGAATTAYAQDQKADAVSLNLPTITAAATGEQVRFTASSNVVQLRLEVYSESGQKVFDSDLRQGNVLDWSVADSAGTPLTDGEYLCVVTSMSLSGHMSRRLGSASVRTGLAQMHPAGSKELSEVEEQLLGAGNGRASITVMQPGEVKAITTLAHNGNTAEVVRTKGPLSFRLGDYFSGQDKEQMRLTEAGNLGIGTFKPEFKLDVAGAIRARGGIVFDDGSALTSSGRAGTVNSAGQTVPYAAGTGTLNFLARWVETGGAGTLGDSGVFQAPNGFIGIGTTQPGHPFVVRRNGGTIGVHTVGELFVDRDNNSRSASLTVGTAGTLKWIFGMPSGTDGFQVYDLTNNVSRFFIDPISGNIGIGTTSPSNKLHIIDTGRSGLRVQTNLPGGTVASFAANGDFQIDKPFAPGGRFIVKENGFVGIGASSPVGNLHLNVPATASPINALTLDVESFSTPPNAVASYYFKARDLGSGSASAFLIRGDGNVGIGTDTPAQKLTVSGTVQSTVGGFKFPDGSVQTSASVSTTYTTQRQDLVSMPGTSAMTIAHLDLPSGTYMLMATIWFFNTRNDIGGNNNNNIGCKFTGDPGLSYYNSVPGLGYVTLTLHSLLSVTSGRIDVSCSADPGGVNVEELRLTAMKFDGNVVTQ